MNHHFKDRISFCTAVAIGLAISTGHPFGIVAAAGMPIACLAPGTRMAAFRNTLGYYSAGLWPMIPGLERYIGQATSHLVAVVIWAFAAILLSGPWALAWTPGRRLHYLWRVPLAIIAAIVPPLGLIGFISPVTAAGYLLPGTGWIGLATTAFLPALVLALRDEAAGCAGAFLRFAFFAVIALALGANVFAPKEVKPPARWKAVNTNFGDISRPFQDFVAAQSIQRRVATSRARVLIFPEFVLPRWSDASKLFWRQTLVGCRIRDQILAIGAGLPRTDESPNLDLVKAYDFTAAIAALRQNDPRSVASSVSIDLPPEPFDNALLVLGAESATYYQRVPVPIGMWRPFSKVGVPLRLNAPGVIAIDHQRAAVLICYEQILTWPILASVPQHPTVIIGISNSFWFAGTPIPRYQASALRAWAKLFGLPSLLAMNS